METIKNRRSMCSTKGCAQICIYPVVSGKWEIILYVVEMVKVFNSELLKLKGLSCVSQVLQWFYGKKNSATMTMRNYKCTAANWDTRSRTRKNQAHRWFLCHWAALSPLGSPLNSVLSLSPCHFFCPILFWRLCLFLPGCSYSDSLECIVGLLLLGVTVI